MPIPFRTRASDEPLGLAAFLRFIDGRADVRAALFLVDEHGAPVDFCFSRAELPRSPLWRREDARRQAIHELAKTLFEACPSEPALLIALANEVPRDLFVDDIEVLLPVCLVTTATKPAADGAGSLSGAELGPRSELDWPRGAPPNDSPAGALLEALRLGQLLVEPFARAARALEEACKPT